VAVLRQAEVGEKVADIWLKGISEATYYAWNGRLKRLVADLSLDQQILQEIVSTSPA
jgi:hypothetical protein